MAEFDALFKCSLGGSSFQLEDYQYTEDPIIEDGKGQTGITIACEGTGYVSAGTPSDFSAALGSASDSFRVIGQNFTITGLGGVAEVTVLAPLCLDGGPHVAFTLLRQQDGAALVKPFKFTLTAKQARRRDSGNNQPTETYKLKVATRPDDLSVVTVSGQLNGVNCSQYFNSISLPRFNSIYRLSAFVPNVTYEGNATNDVATYTLEYKELAETLPIGAGGSAVDGTAIDGVDIDEQMRLVRTLSFDFLCTGDPMVIRDFMRTQLVDPPFKEHYEITVNEEVRLRGEMTLLEGANGNDLMNWERNIQAMERQTDTFTAIEIPGAQPVFIKQTGHGFIYVDSGRAIGKGRFPKKPAWLYQTFGADEEVTYDDLNTVEKQTAWKYTYLLTGVVEDPKTFLKALARPDKPQFLDLPPNPDA